MLSSHPARAGTRPSPRKCKPLDRNLQRHVLGRSGVILELQESYIWNRRSHLVVILAATVAHVEVGAKDILDLQCESGCPVRRGSTERSR